MAAKRKAASAGAALWTLKESPAVRRLIEDEDLRANIAQAYASSRAAYGRLSNGKAPTKQIFDDKKLQRDLSKAATSFRDASYALREGPKRRKRRLGLGRLLLLTIVGAGVAVGVSENLRKKVLDALFGAEEEFEYTSATTAPASTGTTATSPASTTGSTDATVIAPASPTASTTSTDPSPSPGAGQ